tara:strand:- start:567 stop:1802 length:1236 start_codon:yes stop_codon:yes gene_type:complete
MQKWLKFQSQSKILNKRVFAVIFAVVILFTVNSQIYGQTNLQIDISKYLDVDGSPFASDFAEVIETDKIIFEISKDESVRVKHIVIGGVWSPDEPKLIKMLPGKHSNPELTDEDGDYLRPLGFVGETFEESEYIIAGQKSFKAYDLHASYDLENFLELSDNGLWTKHFVFPHDVMIYVDEEIEIVFANSRPIDLSEAGGLNCMGCDLKIEFFEDTEPIRKTVIRNDAKFEEISNTGEKFTLEFFTNGEIGDVKFLNELNYLSFNSNKENQIFMLKIPLDLLLSPYHVYVTESDQEILLESDKIRTTEFKQTDTHANIVFRPTSEGIVHVVGSNEMEHEKLLVKLQEKLDQSEEEKSSSASQNEKVEEKSEENLYEKWGESKINNDDDDTIILIIIGIVAVIIIGIIIKLKK